jgi:L-ectoine synthase
MILRRFSDILPTERAVHTDNWSSFRLLTRADGMGFSLHETWIQPGTETYIHYKHHLEAVYCLEGEGEIELADAERRHTGTIHPLCAGVMYALDRHDRHFLRAHRRLRLICVFNPPLRGDETHDADGAYASPAETDDDDVREVAP